MSSKKCSSSSNVEEDSLSSIGDIPVILLRQISNFLSRSQRSFFAAALSSHAASKSILFPPQHWSTLDFLDVKENDLLSRLTDTDLASVLTCISTVSKLERLQLTCCTNINGCGLQPIAHSVVLKQLDLSLLHPDPWKDNEEAGALSADIVLPILESVIGTENNSLKVLRLPKSWRQNKDSALTEFLERYNRILTERKDPCSLCTSKHSTTADWFHTQGEHYGLQESTCYQCLGHHCRPCIKTFGEELPRICTRCERSFCQSCTPRVRVCDDCGDKMCTDCKLIEACDECFSCFCEDCYQVDSCDQCNRKSCEECGSVRFCQGCDKYYCNVCDPLAYCFNCYSVSNCEECMDKMEDAEKVRICVSCWASYCNECCLVKLCLDCKEYICEDCANKKNDAGKKNKGCKHPKLKVGCK